MFDDGDFLRQFFIENRSTLSRTIALLSEELEVRPSLISAGFETKTATIRQIRRRSKLAAKEMSPGKPAMILEPSVSEARGIQADVLRKRALKIGLDPPLASRKNRSAPCRRS